MTGHQSGSAGTRAARAVRAFVIGAAMAAVVVSASPLAAAQPAQPAQRSHEDLVARIVGKRILKDRATGQVRAITLQEARDLIARVAATTERAATPSEPVVRPGGGSMLSVGDHAGHIVISRYNADGTVSVRCVSSPEEAADFLAEEQSDIR